MKQPKRKSRFSRNGFHTTSEGCVNTDHVPYGYNWALGYCDQGTDEVIAKNTCNKVYMDDYHIQDSYGLCFKQYNKNY